MKDTEGDGMETLIQKKSYDENELVIQVAGMINAQNAREVFEEINALRSQCPDGQLILDFNDLSYISSVGLRGLINLQKKESRQIILDSVQSGVADVLRETGFDRVFTVNPAMRELSVDNLDIIGKGSNGTVYRDDEQVIKVYSEDADLSVIKREDEASKVMLTMKLPVVIAYDVVKVGNCYGTVFESIVTDSLAHTLRDHPEQFDELSEEYVRLYSDIHHTVANKEQFMFVKDIYRKYIQDCSDWYEEAELSRLMDLVDGLPDGDVILHGDFHAGNIMMGDDGLLLIDMADVSYGHPVFDLISTAVTQRLLLELNAPLAEQNTGMGGELITKLWKKTLSSVFAGKSQEELDRIDEILYRLSILKMAVGPVVSKNQPKEILDFDIHMARTELIPYIDELLAEKELFDGI